MEERILDILYEEHPALHPLRDTIKNAVTALIATYESKGKVLTCGNGGSAADAEHIVGELLKGFRKRRPLTKETRETLAMTLNDDEVEMLDMLQQPLPALSLTSHVAFTSAFNNDVRPEYAFAQQVLAFGEKGDVLIALSTSGNSTNVLLAAKVAKARGMRVIALTGSRGGALGDVADITITVPADETYRAQEFHLPIYHALCDAVESYFFDE